MKKILVAIVIALSAATIVVADENNGYTLHLRMETRDHQKPQESLGIVTPYGEVWGLNLEKVNFQVREFKIGIVRPVNESKLAEFSLGLYYSQCRQRSAQDDNYLVVYGKVDGSIDDTYYTVDLNWYISTNGLDGKLCSTDIHFEHPVSNSVRLGLTGQFGSIIWWNKGIMNPYFIFGPRLSANVGKNGTLIISYIRWGTYETKQLQTELIYRF